MMGENGCCQEDVKARIKFAILERDKARNEKEEVILLQSHEITVEFTFWSKPMPSCFFPRDVNLNTFLAK